MNFENIKQSMDSRNMDDHQIPTKINNMETSNMPIQRVRRKMRNEIITQLIIIGVFFVIPKLMEMRQLPKAIYYILIFVTSLITLGYLAKMYWFLNQSSNLGSNSKEAVVSFIYDFKLTLEVYKTAIISGSLLLPLAFFTFYFGRVGIDEELFSNFILLNMPNSILLLCVLGYVLVAILIYFMTVSWSNKLYGKHVKNLEETLEAFDVE